MENEYILSELSKKESIELVKDLLNISFGLELKEAEQKSQNNFNLFQLDQNGFVEIIAIIHPLKEAGDNTLQIFDLSSIDTSTNELRKVYYVNFKAFEENNKVLMKLSIENSFPNTESEYMSIEWIENQLNKNPEIASKHNLKIKSIQTDNDNVKEEIEKNFKNIINSDRSFYAVGHQWNNGKDDQLPRFIKEGIWENGKKEENIDTVNRIKKGDILFTKSSFQQGGKEILRIKAIGVVKDNPKDGHLLNVQWKEIDQVDLPGKGTYRSTITEIGFKNEVEILKELHEKLPNIYDIIKSLDHYNFTVVPNVLDKDYFLKEYSHVTESDEFYFQKAIDVLDEIKNYNNPSIFLDKKDIEIAAKGNKIEVDVFQQLEGYWEKGGEVNSNEFIKYLQKVKPEIASLFILIIKFISIVDKNFWRKDELNENTDKWYIANTGLRQNQLISYMFEYARNGFSIPSNRANIVFYRVIMYLDAPETIINVLSTKHELLISDYYVNEKLSGPDFHKKINEYFGQFELPVNNPSNLTLLFKEIIYDHQNRIIWEGMNYGSDNPIPNKISNDEENNNDSEEEDEQTKDKIPFHLDQVIVEDKLGREPVAKAFTDLLKNDIFKKETAKDHSFIVHLQGEWGSGKSSFLNFIEKNLNDGDEEWIVVNYNAWQNQHIKPPWWTLIDQIYRQSKSKLNYWPKCGLWIKENSRRFIWYNGWQKALILSLIIGFIISIYAFGCDIYKLITGESFDSSDIQTIDKLKVLSDFAKLFITASAGLGAIYSFSKLLSSSIFMRSPEDAVSFMNKAADPMTQIKKHYSKLVDNINSTKHKRQLAIFIDDIDRCNKEYIVQLLEGIQTLFKEQRVLYIVVGDKQWITKSFGNTYKEFAKGEQEEDYEQLGEKFLEKAFQLSIRMPKISDDAKKEYWNYILSPKKGRPRKDDKLSFKEYWKNIFKPKKEHTTEDNTIALKESIAKLKKATAEMTKERIMDPEVMKTLEKSFKISADNLSDFVIEQINKDQEDIRHLLRDLHSEIDANPRSIIRLANNYTMTRSTMVVERNKIIPEKVFRWLVIEDLFPKVKNEIHKLSSLSKIEDFINDDKDIDQQIKNNCLTLLLDKENTRGGALEMEEIKNIIGL